MCLSAYECLRESMEWNWMQSSACKHFWVQPNMHEYFTTDSYIHLSVNKCFWEHVNAVNHAWVHVNVFRWVLNAIKHDWMCLSVSEHLCAVLNSIEYDWMLWVWVHASESILNLCECAPWLEIIWEEIYSANLNWMCGWKDISYSSTFYTIFKWSFPLKNVMYWIWCCVVKTLHWIWFCMP